MTVSTPAETQVTTFPAEAETPAGWAPSWLCLNSGALPGNHRVLTRRAGNKLLVRIPDSTPLLGFASGAKATVTVESADGTIFHARGLVTVPPSPGMDAVFDLG